MNPEFFSGDWNNNDLGYSNTGGNWNLPGLSNIALWSTGDIAPIPLPAGVWLLLSALGVFGLLRRRQLRAPVA